MQIEIEISPIEQLAVDALAVVCFESEEDQQAAAPAVASPAKPDPEIATQSGWLSELRSTGEFTGKLYEMATLYRPQSTGAKRLVVIGGGKQDKFTAVETRRIGGTLVRSLKSKGVRSIALLFGDTPSLEQVSAAVEGALLGAWEADKYKSDPKKNEKQVDSFTHRGARSRGRFLAGSSTTRPDCRRSSEPYP